MFANSFQNSIVLASRQVAAEPGIIVGPIARVFGFLMDWSFSIVYNFTTGNALGLAIILLTSIVFLIMLPLNIRSQRAMNKVRTLKPQEEEIRKRYEGVTDSEKQKKMQEEIYAMYSKNGANPLGGCLPMLVQMPLFFGLFFIMNNVFLYIGPLNDLYRDISVSLQNVPGMVNEVLLPMSIPLVPARWQDNAVELRRHIEAGMSLAEAEAQVGEFIDLNRPEHLSRVLNRFSADQWEYVLSHVPAEYYQPIRDMYEHKVRIITFVGFDLIQISGWRPPGILIPILAALTSLLSSLLGRNSTPSTGGNSMMGNQTIIMVVMPIFMGYITVTLPAGVGLYWIVQNIYRAIQQVISAYRAGLPLFGTQ